MAYTEKYANFDLGSGSDNGTSEANAWQTLASMLAGCAAGDRVNIKRQASSHGPIAVNTTIGPSVAATAVNPIYFRGYTTTIGDGGIWETTVGTTGSMVLTFAAYATYEGLAFNGVASVNHLTYTGIATSLFIRCLLDTAGDNAGSAGGPCSINSAINCMIILGTGRVNVVGANNAAAYMRNSYFIRRKATSGSGHLLSIDNFGRSTCIENCTFVGNQVAEEGIFWDRANSQHGSNIINNRFYGFENAIEIDEEPTGDTRLMHISGNVFSTMTGRAIKRTNTQVGKLLITENLYHSCTSGFTDYDDFADYASNFSLSANPFTNVATGDLSFNDTANGGAVCRARGFRMQDAYDWASMAYLATPAPGGGGGGWGFRRRPRITGA